MKAEQLVKSKYDIGENVDLTEFNIPISSAINMMEEYANQKIEEEKESIRQWLIDEDHEMLAEGI